MEKGDSVNSQTYHFMKHTLRGGAFYTAGNWISKILVVVNVFLILKYLTIYQYGVYKLAFSVYAVMSGLLLSGLDGIVLNEISVFLTKKDRPSIKRLFFEFALARMSLGVFAWACLFFGASLVASYYNANVAQYLKIISFLYLTDSLITVFDIFFRSILNFFVSAVLPLLTEIVKFFIFIYFVIFLKEMDIVKVLFASVAAAIFVSLFTLVYFIFKIRRDFQPATKDAAGISTGYIPKSDRGILFRIIRAHGKWAIAKSYFVNLPDNIRLWLIKILISTEAVAIFSVAMSLLGQVRKLIPLQALNSILPRHVSDKEQFVKTFKNFTKYLFFAFVAVGIVSYFLGPIAVKIVFPKYVPSLPYFKLSLITLLLGTFSLVKLVIYSLRRQKFLFLLPFFDMAAVSLFGFLLMRAVGLWGAPIELIISSSITLSITYFYLIKIWPELKVKLKDIFHFGAEDKSLAKELYSNSIAYFKNKLRFKDD